MHAIKALGEALAGSGRPLAVTSGTALIAPGRVVTEQDVPAAGSFTAPAPAEAVALSFAERGVRVSVVRFPLTVHGGGRSRLHPGPHRHRPRQGSRGVPGRRVQPVVRRAPAGRRARVPARAGGSPRPLPSTLCLRPDRIGHAVEHGWAVRRATAALGRPARARPQQADRILCPPPLIRSPRRSTAGTRR